MNFRRSTAFLTLCILPVVLFVSPAIAQPAAASPQRVLLKSGYELTGHVTSLKDADSGRTYIVVRKPNGTTLKLDKSLLVRKITSDTVTTVKYRQQAERAQTAKDHRRLVAWCLQQPSGRRIFEDQIERHSLQIIAQEPDDAEARRQLGYDRAEDGQWFLKEQYFAEHGYIKDGTSWSPALTAGQENRDDAVDVRVAQRKASLAQWQRMAGRRDVSRADLEQAMFAFCDEYAIGLVERLGKQSKNDFVVRSICVEAIGRVENGSAMGKLVGFAMLDPDYEIQERALTLLGQEHYDQQAAARMMIQFLDPKRPNEQIQRAAYAIGELAGDSVVSELVEVLVTTHKMKNPDALAPGRMNAGFDRNGGGGGLQTGGGPQMIARTIENQQVLGTLKSLTGQDFGYDADRWREWFIEAKTHYDVNVRND